MKVIYHVLYRNGHEDIIPQEITVEEFEDIAELNEIIQTSFREGYDGNISLGNKKSSGSFIRLSDVIRVRVEVDERKTDK